MIRFGLLPLLKRLRAKRANVPAQGAANERGRTGFLIAGAVLLAAANLAWCGAVVWHLREAVVRGHTKDIESLNLVLAEQTARTFQSIDLMLVDLARVILGRGIATPEQFRDRMAGLDVSEQLRGRITGMPQLAAVGVIDADGDAINFLRFYSPMAKANVADRDYFKALRESDRAESFVSAPVQNRATGIWTFYMARRVNGPEGVFLGVVLGAVALDHFEDFYKRVYLGNNAGISLFRTDGTLLARFPHVAKLTAVPSAGVLQNFAKVLGDNPTAGTARVVGTINPVPLLLTVRRVPGYPLYTTVSVPEHAILTEWREIGGAILSGGVVVSIAIAVIAWLLHREFTARRRITAARAERDEAAALLKQVEAVSRAKSDFLAHMSHELRTPLNAIIGFSELMREEMLGPLGAAPYKGYVADIHGSGHALLALVNDILDFTQANAGRLSIERRPVDLRTAIEGVASLMRIEAERAGLTFAIDVPPDLAPALADDKRVRQVLINLVGNAVKFTPAGGRITVGAQQRDGRIAVTVADTGPGIPAAVLAAIFEPFSRARQPHLAARKQGAGLGLPICKHLVELMGGTIALDSRPGTGTVATVLLPAVVEPAARQALAAD